MKKEIASTLKAKYSEEFTVKEAYFDKSQNLYLFVAHPAAQPEIEFEGTYDERESEEANKIDHDAYPNEKFSYQAGQYYKSLFPNKELKHIASASVHTDYKHKFGNEVPEWSEYLDKRSPKSTVKMNTYFFEIPDRPFHQIVVTLRAILEEMHSKYNNNYSLYAGFWPKGFLEGKNLDEMTFGFDATSEEDADHLINKMQYLQKVLFIKIVNGSVDQIDEEKLFHLIKDDNKNGQNEMIEI
ncbi:hypothetical protein [Portibacter marinus]|uniref:hypothetical protein n=1 Tax=Portibacter marinus TaxID=2898660 RepID=UPI001F388F5B|nr:hypothetical protein [Portibacter marinus]